MRVLVTGASGFIGRWVVAGLTRRGHTVIAVRRGNDCGQPGGNQVHWRSVDLLKQVEVESLLAAERPAGLVHCAWDTTLGAYWTSSENLKWVATSLHLMEAFASHGGRRAVVAGTSAEYCWQTTGQRLSERTSRIAPDSLYGISKNSLRQILEQWAPTVGISLAWGRIFCPFGPGEHPDRLVPRLIRQLGSGKPLPFDSGNLIRDFLSVQDLGDAFASLFDCDLEGPVNVASGQAVSIRELVTWIAQSVGNESLSFGVLPDHVGQPKEIVADISLLQNEVRWAPAQAISDRISETCEWWLANPAYHTHQLKKTETNLYKTKP